LLSNNLVRVKFARERLVPHYIDENDPALQDVAKLLLKLFRESIGRTRGELEEEIIAEVGDTPAQVVEQGLAKLLDDRCDFAVDSGKPPDEIREKIFMISAARRAAGTFDRAEVLAAAAQELELTIEQVELGLFADLKVEQRLMKFDDFTAEQLLRRYNVALAQSILLRSTGMTVTIEGETPARFRQVFRAIKFHRLICEIIQAGPKAYTFRLDGPMSLFSSTQKYGVQLANFLPNLLHCKKFELKAEVRWGAQRKEKTFVLTAGDGLKSHLVDHGDYVPKELEMFAQLFRGKIKDWDLSGETTVLPAGKSFWMPDFVLEHRKKKERVYLEIFGFWRRTDVEKLYGNLKANLAEPFILAVSESFNIDEETAKLSDDIYVFKRSPLPAEIVERAERLV